MLPAGVLRMGSLLLDLLFSWLVHGLQFVFRAKGRPLLFELAELSLEKEEVLDLLKEAGVKVDAKGRVSGGVSLPQFISFVRCLDPYVDEDGGLRDEGDRLEAVGGSQLGTLAHAVPGPRPRPVVSGAWGRWGCGMAGRGPPTHTV